MKLKIGSENYTLAPEYAGAGALVLAALLLAAFLLISGNRPDRISVENTPSPTLEAKATPLPQATPSPQANSTQEKDSGNTGQAESTPLPQNSSAPSGEPAGSTSGAININTADMTALMELPNIGEVKAKAIIAYRETKGPFKKPEDLLNIKGIGEKTLEKLKPHITLGP